MYTTGSCPYCIMARRFIEKKGVEYFDIRIDLDPERRDEMERRSERSSVPQIFVDEVHIGGFDDLQELEFDGELDKLLNS